MTRYEQSLRFSVTRHSKLRQGEIWGIKFSTATSVVGYKASHRCSSMVEHLLQERAVGVSSPLTLTKISAPGREAGGRRL